MPTVSSGDAIERIAQVLQSETTFVAIFGSPVGSTTDEKIRWLKKEYRRLARLTHPDHAPHEHEAFAAHTFATLKDVWEAAVIALHSNNYDQSFSSRIEDNNVTTGVVIQSNTTSYQLDDEPYWTGDISSLYRARVVGDGLSVIIKIADEPSYNGLLENEAKILQGFTEAHGGSTLASVARFVPKLIETFTISDEERRSFRLLVMPFAMGYVSLTEIIRAFPNGLDPRDVAWIARRVIAQALAASAAGVVHGAITPDHVLVHPITHEPLHIGWVHSVNDTKSVRDRLTYILDRWKEWYPPEVFAKEPITHLTDIYMVGKTVIWLFGGNPESNFIPKEVPRELAHVILACVEISPARRPTDGKHVLDEFTRVVRTLWGSAYRPLIMPKRA